MPPPGACPRRHCPHGCFHPASRLRHSNHLGQLDRGRCGQNSLWCPWAEQLATGLVPLGVKSYVLHPGGGFEVTLPGECNFFVTVAGKQFKFRYGSSVSGIITSGSISRVSGVRIQVEFAWLGLNQVSRAGNQLNIQLEKSTQLFPISAFAQSARCSWDFDLWISDNA